MFYSILQGFVHTGVKIHWQDIELISERPSSYHYPVIENETHTGEWYIADYEQAFNAKQAEIVQKFKLAMAPVTSLYTDEEIASFPTQEPEALAWDADNTAPTPLIDGLLAERTSVDKATLVQRIIDNSAAYKALAGPTIGKKQHFEDLLYALKTQHEDEQDVTQADIDAILVDYS